MRFPLKSDNIILSSTHVPYARLIDRNTPVCSFCENDYSQKNSGVEVIGVAGNAAEALDLIRAHQPDVLIIDIRDQLSNSLDILMQIRNEYPNIQIIGRTKNISHEFFLQAVAAGVTGFINDQTPYSELMEAIRNVRQGYAYLPQNLANQFVRELHCKPSQR